MEQDGNTDGTSVWENLVMRSLVVSLIFAFLAAGPSRLRITS